MKRFRNRGAMLPMWRWRLDQGCRLALSTPALRYRQGVRSSTMDARALSRATSRRPGDLRLTMVDLDGDGDLDVAGNIGEPNGVFFGDGAGNFPEGVMFGSADGPTYALALADLDLNSETPTAMNFQRSRPPTPTARTSSTSIVPDPDNDSSRSDTRFD